MKEHKKLYKKGKLWVTATLFAAILGVGISTTASADSTTTSPSTVVTQTMNTQTASVTTTTANAATNAASNITYNQNDHGNYGYLDSSQLTNNQLNVSGWHATNATQGKPDHYIIAYDNTIHQELSRTQVTTPVVRPDVQQVHNVYNASQSGFNVQLKLTPNAIANGDNLSIVSRYSNNRGGRTLIL